MNEYLIMLKEDLIKEMSHHDAKDDVHEREWKQTMTAFWDMFEHGTYVTTVTCTKCDNTSPTEGLFETLILYLNETFHRSPEKKTNSCTLGDMLLHRQRNENELDWACTNCKAAVRNAKTNFLVTQYPKILYINIHRGSNDDKLIDTAVDFPVENFYPYNLLGQFDSTNGGVRYNLVGSIYRCSKTRHKGHFYAICKDDSSGVWHQYDDHEITMSSLQKKNKNGMTIYVPLQRAIDVLVYVQQDPPIYQDDTSSLFSGVTTTIQQVDSNSSGKISSVTGGEYDTNYNLREDNITVCNESSLANIHIY